MAFSSHRIASQHVLDSFSCGNDELDRWLKRAALDADRAGAARSFLWADGEKVVAYFSLCPHEVRRDALPARLARSGPGAVPAILLARLALDRRWHGQGLGEQLLVDALGRATAAIALAGGRLVAVDAIDSRAARFYERYGFRSCPGAPLRLVRKASDIAASLVERQSGE